MNLQEIKFLKSVFAFQQLGYAYYRDKYAVQLMQRYLEKNAKEGQASISSLKNCPFGFLLNKKPLKTLTTQAGGNILNVNTLEKYAENQQHLFTISVGHWGEKIKKHRKDFYYQTTRPGYSLVLQINFAYDHDLDYYRLVQPKYEHPFPFYCHPVCKNKIITMGWVRLDLDLDTGEVLIEEIQNDWLREVKTKYHYLCYMEKRNKKRLKQYWLFDETRASLADIKQYYEVVLQPYYKIWDEALLSAALWFSWKELGIGDIYYHTYESGCKLKDCEPPRSLYTKLPRRFGFKMTNEAPQFIQDCFYLKKTLKQLKPKWWRLNL